MAKLVTTKFIPRIAMEKKEGEKEVSRLKRKNAARRVSTEKTPTTPSTKEIREKVKNNWNNRCRLSEEGGKKTMSL